MGATEPRDRSRASSRRASGAGTRGVPAPGPPTRPQVRLPEGRPRSRGRRRGRIPFLGPAQPSTFAQRLFVGVEVHLEGDVRRRPDLAPVGAEQPSRGGAELAEHRTCHRLRLQSAFAAASGGSDGNRASSGFPAEAPPRADEHELAEPPGARAGQPRAPAPSSVRSARAGGRRGREGWYPARSARRPPRPFSHPHSTCPRGSPASPASTSGMMRAPPRARAQPRGRRARPAAAAGAAGHPTPTGEPLPRAGSAPPPCASRATRGRPGDDLAVSGAGWLARAGGGRESSHVSCRGRPRLEAGRSCEMTMRWGWLKRPSSLYPIALLLAPRPLPALVHCPGPPALWATPAPAKPPQALLSSACGAGST